MRIVFVHGRSQQGKDPVALTKEWRDALTYGLARADSNLPRDTEFTLPFYGDRLAELVAEVERPLPKDLGARGVGEGDPEVANTQRELLEAIALGAGVTDDDIRTELSEAQPRDPQNWGWVLATARALGKVPGLDGELIKKFVTDVSIYVNRSGVRKAIDRIVSDAIGDEDFVIVSHSLGTVVAYNVLRDMTSTTRCKGFLTLGSPLGIDAVRSKLRTPLTSPVPEGLWFNAFDPSDIVALYPLDRVYFDVAPPVTNFDGVKNFTDNRHGIAGYLADQVVARRIATASAVRVA